MDLRPQRTAAGTCGFRLMPSDPLVEGPSQAARQDVGPESVAVTYTWTHPQDGPQEGALLIGSPDDDGSVQASWFDTWHHRPTLMHLHGARGGAEVRLSGTYAEQWGWLITLVLPEDGSAPTAMTMCNVVPESALDMLPPDAPSAEAGPYEVMVAEWIP